MDADIILALFRPTQIREKPPDQVEPLTEDQRQRQRELLDDLHAEQIEKM